MNSIKLTALTLTLGLALGSAGTHASTLRWAAQNDVLTMDPHSQNQDRKSVV